MISIPEVRKLLGPAADKLSDEKIDEIRTSLDHLAGIIFEVWLKRRDPHDEQSEPRKPV
jgi:hypothetical protein